MRRKVIKSADVACWILTIVGAVLIIAFRHSNPSVMWFGLGLSLASLTVDIVLNPIDWDDDNEFEMDDDYSVFEEENDEDD